MKTLQLSGHTIELYDSVDEMPMVRYHHFTKAMVLSAGEGSDLPAIRSKLSSIVKMIEDNQPEKAKVELLNLYQSYYFIDNLLDPRSLAMAYTVHSIDGVVQETTSNDAAKAIADKLDKWMSKAERDGATESVKKKIEDELAYYFPEHTERNGEMLALLEREIELRIQRIERGDDLNTKDPELERVRKRIRAIANENVQLYTEYERESDVAYEQGCLAITGELHKDAKTMSVMEYHAAIKLLEQRTKELEKAKQK